MRFILLSLFLLSSFATFAQRNCGAHHRHVEMHEKHPELRQRSEEIEKFTQEFIEAKKYMKADLDGEIIIPVVYHVLYNSSTQNISDQRLLEQIEVLNEDFNAMNKDIIAVPAPFQALIGSFKIKFVLANRDPQGNPTTGINRYSTTKTSFTYTSDDIKKSSRGGADAWDPFSYLNIWVGNISGGILGYASFPDEAGTSTDGVALSYRYVGKTGASKPYNLGRTATHEVGHYFNLYHIWGDMTGCRYDDKVTDTPPQNDMSSGVPVYPKTDACSPTAPGIMFMNYMDYSDDATLLMFTKEQVKRMEATLNGPRKTLTESKGYMSDISLDAGIERINSPVTSMCDNTFKPSIRVINYGVTDVTSLEISMKIDNGTPAVGTWTGKITQGNGINLSFGDITLGNGNHSIAFEILKVNEQVDNKIENNSKSVSFNVGVSTRTLPFTERFETTSLASNGITIANYDNFITWERSGMNSSSEGNYSYYMNNYEYNVEELGVSYGQYDEIQLPYFDFRNTSNIDMTFDMAAAQYTALNVSPNNWDTLQVLVSTDCGATYEVIFNKWGADLITYKSPLETFYTAKPSEFRQEKLSLNKYAGMNNVKIIIRNISQFENNIYVDNLNIRSAISTGIQSQLLDKGITIYPNPSHGQVTLKMDDNSARIKQIIWINAMGQQVLEQTISTYSPSMQFDLSQQPKGLYIAKMLFEDGSVATEKLLLN